MHFGGNKEAFPYCAIKSKKRGVFLSMSNITVNLVLEKLKLSGWNNLWIFFRKGVGLVQKKLSNFKRGMFRGKVQLIKSFRFCSFLDIFSICMQYVQCTPFLKDIQKLSIIYTVQQAFPELSLKYSQNLRAFRICTTSKGQTTKKVYKLV